MIQFDYMDVSENSGFSPQIIPLRNWDFHYFHHPFWGFHLFLETRTCCCNFLLGYHHQLLKLRRYLSTNSVVVQFPAESAVPTFSAGKSMEKPGGLEQRGGMLPLGLRGGSYGPTDSPPKK